MDEDTVFIRADLIKTATGNVAYYRLTKELVDFLNHLEQKVGIIEGITLDRKEDNHIGFNIGFICGKEKRND